MAVMAVDCGGTNLIFGRGDSPAGIEVAGVVPTPQAAAGAGEALFGPVRATLSATVAGAGYRAPTPVVVARFGSRAGLVGAAMAAEEARW